MKCRSCQRPIKPSEPIWAYFSGIHHGNVFCQECWPKWHHSGLWQPEWLHELQCLWCGRVVHTRTSRDRITCSAECQRLHRQRRVRENMRPARAQAHKAHEPLPAIACEHCEQSFVPKHPAAQYCSNACRQAAYRKRNRYD